MTREQEEAIKKFQAKYKQHLPCVMCPVAERPREMCMVGRTLYSGLARELRALGEAAERRVRRVVA